MTTHTLAHNFLDTILEATRLRVHNLNLAESVDARRARAMEESVPPYCVFSDKVLREIARQAPENLDDLSGVSGVGPAKLGKYGELVLGVLNGE